jgi:hypothetical protein
MYRLSGAVIILISTASGRVLCLSTSAVHLESLMATIISPTANLRPVYLDPTIFKVLFPNCLDAQCFSSL